MSGHALNGSVAVITGGAGGIGAATAREFVKAGARVVVADIDAARAEQTAASLDGPAVGTAVDVRDPESFRALMDFTEQRFGPVDIMVNNAGVLHATPFETETTESIRLQVEVNLLGPTFGTQAALQRMLPRGHGAIVNVASIAGVSGIPFAATYTATKHGVVGLNEALRIELTKSGIRFTTVYPTHVRTPMTADIPENKIMSAIEPEEVARAIVHAVENGTPDVFVPRHMGLLRTGRALLPVSVLAFATRLIGADRQLGTAAR